MISALLVAAEHIEWRQDTGADLAACVDECRQVCALHRVKFDADSASWDDLVKALAAAWKHLDRTKALAA